MLLVELVGRDNGYYWNDVDLHACIIMGAEFEFRILVLLYMCRRRIFPPLYRKYCSSETDLLNDFCSNLL